MERKGFSGYASFADHAIGLVLQRTAYLGSCSWLDVCAYREARGEPHTDPSFLFSCLARIFDDSGLCYPHRSSSGEREWRF